MTADELHAEQLAMVRLGAREAMEDGRGARVAPRSNVVVEELPDGLPDDVSLENAWRRGKGKPPMSREEIARFERYEWVESVLAQLEAIGLSRDTAAMCFVICLPGEPLPAAQLKAWKQRRLAAWRARDAEEKAA